MGGFLASYFPLICRNVAFILPIPGVLYGRYNPDTNEVEALIDKSSIVELQIPKRYNLSKSISFMDAYKGYPAECTDESHYFIENKVSVYCVKCLKTLKLPYPRIVL